MRDTSQTSTLSRLILDADTAADLMTRNPVAIRQEASLQEAAGLMLDKDVSALPVLNESGRPVGVLSRTDIVRRFREAAEAGTVPRSSASAVRVRDVMTAALLSVSPSMTALEVVAQMLGLGNVHQLFVVDDAGALVGVISARDVLRRLRRLETV